MLAVFDSCHSGSALDLPYQYHPDGRVKEASSISLLKSAGDSLKMGNKKGAASMLMGALSHLTSSGNDSQIDNAVRKSRAEKSSRADVVSLSGCKDSQTSADTFVKGVGSSGAMSYALLKVLRSNPRLSYGQLLVGVRDILRNEYSQVPQLSSAKPMSLLNEPFMI